MLQPVRARVELRRVCLVLVSRAKRWTPPRPLDEDAGAERLYLEDIPIVSYQRLGDSSVLGIDSTQDRIGRFDKAGHKS